MNDLKAKEKPLYYASCPHCKTILVQAQNGMDGYAGVIGVPITTLQIKVD